MAELVWSRLGDVSTYNEPFAGGLSVLLGRPHPPRVETVNDLDVYIANFFRALQHDPEQVAYYCDWPVNEADLHARHRWLVEVARATAERCMTEPDFYDAKIAGWWVYGQCLWIGSGWCQAVATQRRTEQSRKRPKLRERGTDGVAYEVSNQFDRNANGTTHQKRRPQLTGDQGVVSRHANGADSLLIPEWAIRPDLSSANGRGGVMLADKLVKNRGGNGVHAKCYASQRTAATRSGENPSEQRKKFRSSHSESITGVHRRWQGGGEAGGGSGVHAIGLTRQLPQRGALSVGVRTQGLYDYMHELAARLRRVRVCCGDWTRVLTPSVTTYIGLTGVFLDPPYAHELRERCYSEDHDISQDVAAWAREHGDDPNMRIALCGYAGEHTMPDTWECVPWRAHGGYSRSARGKANRDRERIWFSPSCLRPSATLLSLSEATA